MRLRLRITARRRLLSKMLPRVFGSRIGAGAEQDARTPLREALDLMDSDPRQA